MVITWLILLIVILSVIVELLTLQVQMHKVYLFSGKANKILRKNWKLVCLYGLVAIVASPITILSVITGCRCYWEEKLYNSIKNNLYIKEKV